MNPETEHISPDGTLRFAIWRDGDDISLGFSGYAWHTHADLLAGASGVSEQVAVARFVDDLVSDRAIIAVSSVGGVVRDVWVTDDPVSELRFKPNEEDLAFRYWSGRIWQAS